MKIQTRQLKEKNGQTEGIMRVTKKHKCLPEIIKIKVNINNLVTQMHLNTMPNEGRLPRPEKARAGVNRAYTHVGNACEEDLTKSN